MQRRVRVVLTCVGGLGIPKLVEHLRAIPDIELTLFGVDANPDAIGASFVDEFHVVPPGTDIDYSKALLDICSKNPPDLIIPFSDEEAIRLSEDRALFAERGCVVICSPPEVTRTASNKYTFLSHLRGQGIPTPKFFRPRSKVEMETALRELGYPNRQVVFKPLNRRGSRGFRLIDPTFDELDHLLNSQTETFLSLSRLERLLAQGADYPDFMLMEYLAGDTYSVDVLVRGGHCRYIVPQRKLAPAHGSLKVGLIEENLDVGRMVTRIVEAFDFEYLINIDMSYQTDLRQGEIFAYDLNARPSAVISATAGAGCFLLEEAIFQALGVERPIKKFCSVKMSRYWNERYLSGA